MKKISVLIFSLIVLLLIAGCTGESSQIEKVDAEEVTEDKEFYEEKIKDLKEQNNEYKIRNEELKKESSAYKDFIQELLEYLDDNELLELAKKEWNYDVEVDGKSIVDSKDIEINNNNFTISISEKQGIISYISVEELSDKGSLDGESGYKDHLEIVGIEPTDIRSTDGTVVTSFVYEFKDIPKNTSFQLKLSNELKERLSLENSIINIHVK